MKLGGFHSGAYTNSSSAHNILILKGPVSSKLKREHELEEKEGDFGWESFLQKTSEGKKAYIASQLYSCFSFSEGEIVPFESYSEKVGLTLSDGELYSDSLPMHYLHNAAKYLIGPIIDPDEKYLKKYKPSWEKEKRPLSKYHVRRVDIPEDERKKVCDKANKVLFDKLCDIYGCSLVGDVDHQSCWSIPAMYKTTKDGAKTVTLEEYCSVFNDILQFMIENPMYAVVGGNDNSDTGFQDDLGTPVSIDRACEVALNYNDKLQKDAVTYFGAPESAFLVDFMTRSLYMYDERRYRNMFSDKVIRIDGKKLILYNSLLKEKMILNVTCTT